MGSNSKGNITAFDPQFTSARALQISEAFSDPQFTPEHAGRIREAFLDNGAVLVNPEEWSLMAVNLNVLDMSYQGWVPQDIAQQIMCGDITEEQIPADFHTTMAHDGYTMLKRTLER